MQIPADALSEPTLPPYPLHRLNLPEKPLNLVRPDPEPES